MQEPECANRGTWTWVPNLSLAYIAGFNVIKFLCPNGHPLSTSQQRAGKPGQCPRCQSTFVVPDSEDSMPVAADNFPADANSRRSPVPTEDEDRKFDFLCPNGHKLHGRSNQQGRPGQCPHCNARFLIPSQHGEEDFDEASLDDEDPGSTSVDTQDEEADDGGLEPAEAVVFSVHDEPPPAPLSVSCHPLAQIIRNLWAETRGAGVLELRLDDGVTLLAESFSAELSQHDFGVFAVEGEAKTQSITIIAWESIQRATLLNLAELPSDLFRSRVPNPRRQDRAQ